MTDHTPVLLNKSIDYLKPKGNKIIIDCTLGLGGHSKAILQKLDNKGRLIGIDQDGSAVSKAKENLKGFEGRFTAVKNNFSNIKNILSDLNINKVDGILFDLGVSSMQIDTTERGFSLRKDGPLDMRMDRSKNLTAANIVNDYSQNDLEQIIRDFGEERMFRRIARKIVDQRKNKTIETTFELVAIIKKAIPRMNPKKEINTITRVFQAVRISVNDELNTLKTTLKDSIEILGKGGRLVVISYHSLEDRIVKRTFRTEASECLCPPKQLKCTCNHKKKLTVITRKPIIPEDNEIMMNPRSRSAKLRCAEKI